MTRAVTAMPLPRRNGVLAIRRRARTARTMAAGTSTNGTTMESSAKISAATARPLVRTTGDGPPGTYPYCG